MQPSFILSKNSLTVYIGTDTFIVKDTNSFFVDAIKAIRNKEWDSLRTILDKAKAIEAYGPFKVIGNVVHIDGEPVPSAISNKIIEFMDSGFPHEPLIAFWKNLRRNPDKRAQTDLYAFLEKQGHPITEDGCFIAYKRVADDFSSLYHVEGQPKIYNRPGDIVNMPREDVDNDPTRTCSSGLHVANYNYAANFYSGNKLVNVKVNPEHVVAIPIDYNQEKMRVCQYEVLGETEAEYKSSYVDDTYKDRPTYTGFTDCHSTDLAIGDVVRFVAPDSRYDSEMALDRHDGFIKDIDRETSMVLVEFLRDSTSLWLYPRQVSYYMEEDELYDCNDDPVGVGDRVVLLNSLGYRHVVGDILEVARVDVDSWEIYVFSNTEEHGRIEEWVRPEAVELYFEEDDEEEDEEDYQAFDIQLDNVSVGDRVALVVPDCESALELGLASVPLTVTKILDCNDIYVEGTVDGVLTGTEIDANNVVVVKEDQDEDENEDEVLELLELDLDDIGEAPVELVCVLAENDGLDIDYDDTEEDEEDEDNEDLPIPLLIEEDENVPVVGNELKFSSGQRVKLVRPSTMPAEQRLHGAVGTVFSRTPGTGNSPNMYVVQFQSNTLWLFEEQLSAVTEVNTP